MEIVIGAEDCAMMVAAQLTLAKTQLAYAVGVVSGRTDGWMAVCLLFSVSGDFSEATVVYDGPAPRN